MKSLFHALLACSLLGGCLPSEGPDGPDGPAGPAGPVCQNRTASAAPCADCDAADSSHAACYDAFTHAVLPVFRSYCLGCHSTDGMGEFLTGGADSGLNFEPGLAYRRLMLPSFGDTGTTLRVVPGHPETSALYNKITADDNTVWFGAAMPQGRALIHSDAKAVETIRKWIAGGAKPPAVPAAGPK